MKYSFLSADQAKWFEKKLGTGINGFVSAESEEIVQNNEIPLPSIPFPGQGIRLGGDSPQQAKNYQKFDEENK